ncbi:cationic amino acid transporter 4 [Galendromus occidentalis]|uniref:Cationic amino acid transporter 4 n=1 Tax=Galendromus occidentalis TaxID=34638 RepID=A0AAJ7SH09_9ACAR|nr:cationic amino acid transporter 4 [Galendromus occidentalis]
MASLFAKLTRKKHMEEDHMQTNLKRCLTTFDITLLGIGHMMGSGIYVLTPTVARDVAGPAIILSYLVAGIASLLAALAYAEFGVKFPRAGSAYSYSYFSVGEFWAFFVGWNVLLENVIGISAVARACSEYIDNLCGGVIRNWLMTNIGALGSSKNLTAVATTIAPLTDAAGNSPTFEALAMVSSGEDAKSLFSEHADLLAFLIIVAYVAFMSVGVQATSWLNNLLCSINIVVLIVIVGVGVHYADWDNWKVDENGQGGFIPNGFSSVLSASATCFFAYVGFDSIAASGEEAKDPQKSLPVATLLSMAIVTALYISVSAVLTLMVKYTEIAHSSGLPAALGSKGAHWAEISVTVGALAGMSTVLIGTLYALTRIAYAMADDGLIHSIFGKVAKKSQIPLIAMYVFSLLAAVLAVVLDIDTLVEMMSIGTLSAYLVVSGGVIIFRYRPNTLLKVMDQEMKPIGNQATNGVHLEYDPAGQHLKPRVEFLRNLFPRESNQQTVISVCVSLITICTFILGFFCKYNWDHINEWYSMMIVISLIVIMILSFLLIVSHEQCQEPQKYKMPWVPVLPVCSIIVNAILMTTLQLLTWGRLVLWLAIGLTGYFTYGLRHSKLN